MLHFIHTLEVLNPCTAFFVKSISVVPNRWCILGLKEGDEFKNVLLATPGSFSENEAFNISVALKCVMLCTGRDADGNETCNFLTFNDILPAVE